MPDTTVALLLTTILAAIALRLLFVALGLRRRVQRMTERLDVIDERFAGFTQTLPRRVARQMETLKELNAQGERVLWTLSRLDERLDTVSASLAERRSQLDTRRVGMVSA